jgi:hypothetical protein
MGSGICHLQVDSEYDGTSQKASVTLLNGTKLWEGSILALALEAGPLFNAHGVLPPLIARLPWQPSLP